MAVIAFDQAKATGWAVWFRESGEIWSGAEKHKTIPGRDSRGSVFARMEVFLEHLRRRVEKREKLELIVYEDGFSRNKSATMISYGMIAIIQKHCAMKNIPYTSFAPSSVKKFATGSGQAQKEEMLQAAQKQWPGLTYKDDNEVDARWLLLYGLKDYYNIELRRRAEHGTDTP